MGVALLATALALLVALLVLATRDTRRGAPREDAQQVEADALQRRTQADLRRFTDWLATKGAQGYIGEVGWPRDDARWNDLARAWFRQADAAGLWVTAWATGEWWGTDYPLGVYRTSGDTPVDSANQQAQVLEGQPHGRRRGVNVNGGEFGAISGHPEGSPHTATFSNANPRAYDTDYHYDSQASFDYLASQGITTVRLAFRWERLQPSPGGELSASELRRLTDCVDRAGAAGLEVVLNLHNYGAYYLSDGDVGVRRALGSDELPHAHFVDLWRRVSVEFQDDPHVLGYGLMNEPNATPGGAAGWEDATQAAVDAIRSTGDDKTILVPGYNSSTVIHFPGEHPRGPWIEDPADNVRYEAHQYFDADNSGDYDTYDRELAKTETRGY